MGIVLLSANGPFFKLFREDIDLLLNKNKVDLEGDSYIKKGRIILKKKDPNYREYPNGGITKIDYLCESGLRLRRFPENCCPFETSHLVVLEISKKKLNEILSSNNEIYKGSFENNKILVSRCKYDRFVLSISSD
jgi:hypothetical protein